MFQESFFFPLDVFIFYCFRNISTSFIHSYKSPLPTLVLCFILALRTDSSHCLRLTLCLSFRCRKTAYMTPTNIYQQGYLRFLRGSLSLIFCNSNLTPKFITTEYCATQNVSLNGILTVLR